MPRNTQVRPVLKYFNQATFVIPLTSANNGHLRDLLVALEFPQVPHERQHGLCRGPVKDIENTGPGSILETQRATAQ